MRCSTVEDQAIARAADLILAVARLEGPSLEVSKKDHHRQTDVVAVGMRAGYSVNVDLYGSPHESFATVVKRGFGNRVDALCKLCVA